MDSNHDQQSSSRDKGCSDKKHEEGKIQVKHPSASSSPSHEFSFTISLHSSTLPDKAKPPPSFAIDLSPADDIFFHGHLLPLHLLSHLPVSPRSSINSTDSFTLPAKDLLREDHKQRPTKETNNQSSSTADDDETTARSSKTKSFSLLGFINRWRSKREEDKEKQKRKAMRVDVRQVVKRYVRMVQQPLFLFKGRRESMQPYSLSGNLAFRNKPSLRGRRGEFSAPASMRTSPSNSGLLVATETALPSSKTDSTMEELHAAIQAAIAHCKNSNIAAHDIDHKIVL